MNNACSFEIQRGTDKELNQELAEKSQFLVAPGSGRLVQQHAKKQNGEPPESEWLAVRAVVVSGQAMLRVLIFSGDALGIQ